MDLRQILTPDIMRDPELVTVYLYCLRETQASPTVVNSLNGTIALRPYEVLLDVNGVAGELKKELPIIQSKLQLLTDLKRITMESENGYLRIRLLKVAFPINSSYESRDVESQKITLTFERWKEIEISRPFKPKTIEMIQIVLRGFAEIVQSKNLDDIDSHDGERYLKWLKEKPVSATTIGDYLRTLKASFNRAEKEGYLTTSPMKALKPPPTPRIRPVILEKEDFQRLLEMIPNETLRDPFIIAIQTGMRRGEVAHLKWKQIDFEKRLIQIRCDTDFRPKQDRERDIPMNQEVIDRLKKLQLLQSQLGIESAYVFLDTKGNRIKDDALTKGFKLAVRAAGLSEKLSLHSLRRTFASVLSENGGETAVISDLLGHADRKTTQRYIGSTAERMEQQVAPLTLSRFLPSE